MSTFRPALTRHHRVFLLAIVIAAVGGLILLCWTERTRVEPPGVNLIHLEPIGLYDERGTELWLITLKLFNTEPEERPFVFVKDTGRSVEARQSGRWKPVEGTSVMFGPKPMVLLSPVNSFEAQILAPVGSETCRVWLGYAAGVKRGTIKALAGGVVAKLPAAVRARVSYRFWRWVGWPSWQPSSRWREVQFEIPLRAQPGTPGTPSVDGNWRGQ